MNLTQTKYEVQNGIAKVTLSRPDKLNTLTPIMRKELIHLFSEADQDDDVRVVVVTGSGRAFCAGADLSSGGETFDRAFQDGKQVSSSEYRDGGGQISLAIFRCRKPVIAAINGHAVGAGVTITLPMDIRIVAAEAKIGFVFTAREVPLIARPLYCTKRVKG